MKSPPKVLCLALAPAWQRIMVFDDYRFGEVNRARAVLASSGGKAVNTARALALLGRGAIVGGFNGGDTGRLVAHHLRRAGVTCSFTCTAWATRTCITLLDQAGNATELVEEARVPTPELRRRFVDCARRQIRQASFVALCGTLPDGVPVNLWASLADLARARRLPLAIDSHGAPLLAVLSHAPLLVKLNAQELSRTFSGAARRVPSLPVLARRLIAGGAQWVLVTDGPAAALLFNSDGNSMRMAPPRASAVRNPIGSGDCVTAGIIDRLLAGRAMPEAVRFGLACGTANTLTLTPADFSPPRARRLATAVRTTAGA